MASLRVGGRGLARKRRWCFEGGLTPQCTPWFPWSKWMLKDYDVINCLNKNLLIHLVWYLEKEKRYQGLLKLPSSLLYAIIAYNDLPFFKIFPNFIFFATIFKYFAFFALFNIFLPFFCPFSEKSHVCPYFLEYGMKLFHW